MAAALSSSSATAAAAAVVARACFNSHCKDPRPEGAPRRKGWRMRSGEHADLCDRCCGIFEQGAFCETFHSDDAGWRNCESCGKRVHCGCIVSNNAYMLLDAGGIDCIVCARKSMPAPNHLRPSPSFLPLQASERLKDLPAKSWNQMTSSYSGQWRQIPKIWSLSGNQTELQRRISYEFDRYSYNEKLIPGGRTTIGMPERKTDDLSDRMNFSSIGHQAVRDRYANGNSALDSVPTYNTYRKDEGNFDSMQDSGRPIGETDPMSARKGAMPPPCSGSPSGVNSDAYSGPSIGASVLPARVKDESSSALLGLSAPYPLSRDANDQPRVSASQPLGQTYSQSLGKQVYLNPHNVNDSSGELQAQMHNGKPRVDTRGRNHMLSRYCPRITSEELQQISGDTNSVITPLFEKILSASDAGRIGRLVLPKKCAEAYFPPISHPEGLPLKVQDSRGKEWLFQFRFWPNNNSRMYVLEGVTPCIQSMQLVAGDTVTFSRIDPEGRLVMGFRKASSISPEQDNLTGRTGNSFSTPSETNNRNATPTESVTSHSARSSRGGAESKNNAAIEDQANQSNSERPRFIQKDATGSKASAGPTKRKGSALGSKSKRLRIENEDSIELKLSWEEAQELLRPPPDHASNVVVIEGQEIEEYEEAPVLGKPTLFSTDQGGEKHQWAQCEKCSKWRKLPVDALLPFRWTCADNIWDRQRASCISSQELSKEELAALLPCTGASKKSKAKVESESVEVADGLDTLANLAILGEGEALPSSSQATTKHPRHRPGCTCIVCIQPPSGKGPKHNPDCTCNVCLTVKRRFRTLMLRREMRQSGKEAEKKQQVNQSSGVADQPLPSNNNANSSTHEKPVNTGTVAEEESERRMPASSSPLKAKIDLNIQPEREEEPLHARDPTEMPNCEA